MNALITIKCHNRPIFLLQSLLTLSQVKGVDKYDIIVSCDNPDSIMQSQMTELFYYLGMPNSKLILHQNKLGCWGNKKYCLELAFDHNNYDFCLHTEEDILHSKFLLEFCEQVAPMLDKNNFFAACFMHRPVHDDYDKQYNKLIQKKYFEICGGFLISRKQWNRIKEMGGGFAVNYVSQKGRTYDCQGEEWLKEINKCNIGGSGYPFDKYFREGKYCLYPKISLTQNIGNIGEHIKNKEWHKNIQYNENWMGHDDWKNIEEIKFDLSNIETDNRKFIETGIE